MIEVTNGMTTHIIPKGAFKIYKTMGFSEVKHDAVAHEDAPVGDAQTDEEFVEEVESIPLAQWSTLQVKRYAQIYGIDISDTKSKDEALDLIRAFRDEADSEE